MPPYTEKRPRRKLSAQEQADIVKEVRENAELHWQHERSNIDEATMDQRFRANDQWPELAKKQREAEGRPMLTFNQMNQFIAQVVNPIRQADIAIKTSPVDGKSDPELSKVYNGLLRQIQYQSSARAVYAHALDCQAGCGIGWFRICHDYRDDDSFDQEIYIERINNPLAVFWDPAARDPVRCDAMWMGIAEAWPTQAFKARWPNAVEEDVETMQAYGDTLFWFSTETVRVAEYFRKVKVKKTLAKLQDGSTLDITKMGEAELGQMPIEATRTVNSYRIESYFVSGAEVLEGPNEIPGTHIPLIPAVGGEVAMEKGVYRYGVCRFIRDAQQMYNLNRTAMAESIGLAPKAKWIVTDKMVSKHLSEWEQQNKSNKPYLRYTPDEKAPTTKPERISPVEVQPAMTQEAAIAKDDMMSGTGIFNAQRGNRSNETSGVAIDARKMQGEVANYGFLDNFKASLEHAGRILVDWIPEIYDNERVMRIIGEDDKEEETVPINFILYGQDQRPVMVNDLSAAKFDIRVNVGPGYSTRRAEAAEAIAQFMKSVPPEMAGVMADLVASNSDWAGADEIAKRLKAMVQQMFPNVIEAAEAKEGQAPPQQQQPQGPPPELMLQQLMLQLKDMAAKIEKTQAETQKTVAQTQQIEAQTGKTIVDTHAAANHLPFQIDKTRADTAHVMTQAHHLGSQTGPLLDKMGAETQNLLAPQEPEYGGSPV